MNNRNGPLSPVSIGSNNDWPGPEKYQDDNDSPYQMNRGQLASPPISSGSNGTMNGGDFPSKGDSGGSPGNPSPPSSVGRSSIGTGLYAGSENGQDKKDEQFEAVLSEHYAALKRYLAASLRDEKGNPRPNRARDKLLRLSPVQFQELSTDVFDELLRRQQAGRRTPNGQRNDQGPPPHLLPKNTFHPKRNQARQKLSTLPPPRFRDLATDVFFELERRFPQFPTGERSRMGSPVSTRAPPSRNGNGTPVDLPPRGPSRIRRPSDASSIGPYSMRSERRSEGRSEGRSESRNGSRMPPLNSPNGNLGVPPSPGMPPHDYSRPTPKTFQSNTIVPNKSTMVEDDESGPEDNYEGDADAFDLERVARNRDSKKSIGGPDTDKKLIDDYQSQVIELQERLDSMEGDLKRKDGELNIVLGQQRERDALVDADKKEWEDLRMDLENKLADAQNLNDVLQSELDQARESQANSDREFKSQIEELQIALVDAGKSIGSGDTDLERENEELKAELIEQQEITEEVRKEAQEFLREMRMLSERSTASYDREKQLEIMVRKLEDEVKDWRNRYARTKTQLRSLKTSSIGLSIQDAAKYANDSGFTAENGLVKDFHVTKFQLSIDELLQTARGSDPERVIEFMKNVIMNVRQISQDVDGAPWINEELAQKQAKLKSRLSATANNLITASKNFAGSKGLSPVSLLDAAASHLTIAVVELVRTVKIKPTPAGELEDNNDGNSVPVKMAPSPAATQPSTIGGFFGSKPATTESRPTTAEPKPAATKSGGIFGFFASREAKQGNVPPQLENIQQPKEKLQPQKDTVKKSIDSSGQNLNGYERQNENSQKQSLNDYVPGPFLGLRDNRASTDSSLYSPINSPRESVARSKSIEKDSISAVPSGSRENPLGSMTNGADPVNKSLPLALQPPPGPPSAPPSPIPTPMSAGFGLQSQDRGIEDLKIYLEDQTALLVQNIQSLVSSIRSEGGINAISTQIDAIANVVGEVVASTEEAMINNPALRSQSQPVLTKLSGCRARIMAAGEQGKGIVNRGREGDEGDAEWRAWNQSLPPIAFEIARETKELVLRVDVLDEGDRDDDFS